MNNLAVANGFSSKDQLYARYAENILDQLKSNHELWEIHSPEFLIFFTLLTDAGMHSEYFMEKVIPLLLSNLQIKKDPELRVKLFTLLSQLITNLKETVNLSAVVSVMISQMILPNLVWHAGKTATVVRTASTSFLWTLVHRNLVKTTEVESVADQLFTCLISLLTDDSLTTRLLVCKILYKVIPVLFPLVEENKIYNLYPEFLKRMDDASDQVRMATTQVFESYFKSFSPEYDIHLYANHLRAIYAGLLLHMDDANPGVQKAVLDLLIKISIFHPKMLQEEIEMVKERHRTDEFCNQLLNHLKISQ